MPYIVGTAGHIDHGKTSLIKALTGQDTDRLEEEKRRGISIDLGFAHLDLPDGRRAGVVDVPGHERFIRNMLAGAHGIDLVLFTVAADDGVMPQSEEHLDIVHLLGIEAGIFVLTKIDVASRERRAAVREQIEILAAGTLLEGSPIVEFSSVTLEGLDDLRATISRKLAEVPTHRAAGYFRMPIDRAFVLPGHGLVVTGTARSGMVHAGARLRCLPGEQEFRVRSVQVHGESVVAAGQGQRVALNLAGADRAAIERGQVICDERFTRATDRFDALLEVTAATPNGLRNHQRIRVHLGTAERLGRLILLTADAARPRASVFCQVVLFESLFAARGDRFVIRDETARRTLAGGRVIHPWPRVHKRRDPPLAASLATYASADLEAVAAAFIEESESLAVSLEHLSEFLDVQQGDARAVADGSPRLIPVEIDDCLVYITERKWQQLRDHTLAEITAFHAAHPLAAGREMEDLRMRVAPALTPRTFRAVVERLERDGTLAREGSLVRLSSHTVSLDDDAQRLAASITNLLGAAPLTPPNLAEIERALGVTGATLADIIRMMERNHSIVRVGSDVYFLKRTLAEIEQAVTQEFATRGDLTPAAFRDRFGTSRKYTIPLLEYFDRVGVTIRIGDVRKLKRRAG